MFKNLTKNERRHRTAVAESRTRIRPLDNKSFSVEKRRRKSNDVTHIEKRERKCHWNEAEEIVSQYLNRPVLWSFKTVDIFLQKITKLQTLHFKNLLWKWKKASQQFCQICLDMVQTRSKWDIVWISILTRFFKLKQLNVNVNANYAKKIWLHSYWEKVSFMRHA